MAERGLVGDDELAAGRLLHPPGPLPRKLLADAVPAALAKGSPTERPAPGPARFAVGDVVRTRAGHVDHHSRLPGYAQGKRGTIARLHGAHVFPDTHAQGQGEQPQWLYTVVFDGTTLWGAEAQPGLQVSVDAWESYLQADDGAAP
jgi:nitrile hydratase subunit beta